MKKIFFSLLVCLSCISVSFAQLAPPERYTTEIFPTHNATASANIPFSTNIPQVEVNALSLALFGLSFANETTYGNVTKTLQMNIYQPPTTDTLTKRPVIIFAFGGGFVQGDRQMADMIQLCKLYAKRGFVTATIDYRIGMNIGDAEKSKRAVYRGVQDGRSAVRFFRQYANTITYKVDPNQIFIAGHSAGGFVAMHNLYLDTDVERPSSTRANPLENLADLGTLDAIGNNKTQTSGPNNGALISGKANGGLSFAGALGELTYMSGPTDAPAAYFHSSNDVTVPYNTDEPFQALSAIVNLPDVSGGNQMAIKALAVGAPYKFHPYNGSPDAPRGHGVHFDGTNIYLDIPIKGGQFTYDLRLKPAVHAFTGVNSIICDQNLIQTYTINDALNISGNSDFYYDWTVVNGTINTPSSPTAYSATARQYLRTISVTWNATGGARSLSVTAYQRNLAKGAAILTQSFTLNNAPVAATAVSTQNIQIGGGAQTVNIGTAFTDANGNTMTYTATSSNPANLTVSVTGNIVTFTPVTTGTGGAIMVTLIANDNIGGGCASAPVTFVVNINRPPTATIIPNQTLQLGGANGTLNIAPFFTDADGNTLTFTSANATPTVATATLAGSTFTLAPIAGGSTVVTVTANDGNGGTVSQTFTVLVNTAPTAVVIPNQSIQLGAASSTFNIASFFTDADAHTLTFTSTNATPSIATAVLAGSTFTMTSVALGSTIITVTANDGNGGTISQTFTITVTTLPVAVGTIPNQVLQMGGANVVLNLAPYFSSANALTYTVASVPTNIAGTVIAGTNLTLSPVAGGSTVVTVTANNGSGNVTQTFTVLVNRMPTATVIPTQNLRVGSPATVLTLGTYFADADANTLSYVASAVTSSIATATVSVANLSLVGLVVGSTNVTVTANDGNGGTVSQTFAVNVTSCAITATPTITKNLLTLTSSSATNNQWNRNGVAIAGAISNVLNVTEDGSYTVSLVGVTNACAVVTSLPTVISLGDIATSLDKNLENVSLLPNPTKGGFQISMNNALRGDYEVVIFDALGKVQSSKKLNKSSLQVTEQFSIENLAAGIYYVKIISKEGVITKKVVLSE